MFVRHRENVIDDLRRRRKNNSKLSIGEFKKTAIENM